MDFLSPQFENGNFTLTLEIQGEKKKKRTE